MLWVKIVNHTKQYRTWPYMYFFLSQNKHWLSSLSSLLYKQLTKMFSFYTVFDHQEVEFVTKLYFKIVGIALVTEVCIRTCISSCLCYTQHYNPPTCIILCSLLFYHLSHSAWAYQREFQTVRPSLWRVELPNYGITLVSAVLNTMIPHYSKTEFPFLMYSMSWE